MCRAGLGRGLWLTPGVTDGDLSPDDALERSLSIQNVGEVIDLGSAGAAQPAPFAHEIPSAEKIRLDRQRVKSRLVLGGVDARQADHELHMRAASSRASPPWA